MKFADACDFFLSGMGFIYDFIPIIRFLPGLFHDRYKDVIGSRDYLLDKFYLQAGNKFHKTSEEERGLVKNLIKLQTEMNQDTGTEYITDNDMKGIIVDIIAASHATTNAVLTNMFAIMLTHPHVAKTIQEEIDDCVGSTRMPNYADKERMHYTMATVYEVLRYTSPIALNIPHRASRNQNFEGYFIPKDSLLISNHWFIHHDPKLWHEPWVFKPERFLDNAGKLLPLESTARRNIM